MDGPLELVCKLAHCPDPTCPAHAHTLSPLAETPIALPWSYLAWDVFCWLGHRRFARHWSIPQLQAELHDTHHLRLSDDAIGKALRRYQTMVAARHQDATVLAAAYRDRPSLILSIDGLQPEKGHETLSVVRACGAKRVWFAQALLSSSADEIRVLVHKAREWADQLGKPVVLWVSDKQDAFVRAIAAEFPTVPHRYCQNHFLRDVAKPVLEEDSHAKVTMRAKVRGLRGIERGVLVEQRTTPAAPRPATPGPTTPGSADPPVPPTAPIPTVSAVQAGVVLDYCAAVRGILNNNQGGPLHPPGLRMAEHLHEVRDSLTRVLEAKKGGARTIT